jgi:hypothetical protein
MVLTYLASPQERLLLSLGGSLGPQSARKRAKNGIEAVAGVMTGPARDKGHSNTLGGNLLAQGVL